MFDEIIVIGEVAAKQTEEYDKHFWHASPLQGETPCKRRGNARETASLTGI